MEKKYIAPSIKVRQIIESENILAASTLHDNEDGTETQGNVDPNDPNTSTVPGGGALSKDNAWNTWDEDE